MQIAATSTDITKWIAYGPVRLRGIFGYNAHTADSFIQFHTGPTVATSDVPFVKSVWAATQAPFYWFFGSGIWLPSLYLAISTAAPSYQAVGAGEGCDMTLVIDTDYPVTAGTTVAGDLTSGVNSLAVWSEAAGLSARKKLLRVDFQRVTGGNVNLGIYANDSPVAGTSKLFGGYQLTNGANTKSVVFGQRGLTPFAKDSVGEHHGCTIKFHSSPTAFQGGSGLAIRAIYDTL